LTLPAEQFAALSALGEIRHAFTTRVASIDVQADKAEALRRLDKVHREVRSAYAVGKGPLVTAEQVHGNCIGIVDAPLQRGECFAGCDGLITNQPDVCLGIYVADCCAVYLVDQARTAIGLVHSGRKGTELRIVSNALKLMTEKFGSRASDLVVQLSSCIRPPHYEVDFAAEIVASCHDSGVHNVYDSGLCTACDLERYYSYRAEKGKTGRMMAMLAISGSSEQ